MDLETAGSRAWSRSGGWPRNLPSRPADWPCHPARPAGRGPARPVQMERSSLAGTPVDYGQPAVARAAGWVFLPMTQPDIADTLLTIETASRAVTRLEREVARAGARRVGPCRPALRRVPCA